MITQLSNGNILLEDKKNIYKLSSNGNKLLTEKFNPSINSFSTLTSLANTNTISNDTLGKSVNLNFAYNMNQYVRDTDSVKFANLTITGDTLLCGDLNIIPQAINKYQTTAINIGDTLIELATDNLTDLIDIGLYGKYIQNSITKYAGLYRDSQNNGIFKLFKDLTIKPNNLITIPNTTNQADLMLNSLYTGNIKCADFYYDLSINAKNGDNNSNIGGNIILTPGLGYNLANNGNIILSNISSASSNETLLSITSDGKIRNTSLIYNNIPTLNGNNIFLNNLTVNGKYYGTWNGNSISTDYTDAKVKSINGQTGDVVLSISAGGVTSVNGLTGAITDIPTLTANNTFIGTNTFSNTITLSGVNTDTAISSGQKLAVLNTTSNDVQRINITPDTLITTASGTQTITGNKTLSGATTLSSSVTLSGVNTDTATSSGQKLAVLNTTSNAVQRVNITPDTLVITNTTQTISGEKSFNTNMLKAYDIYSLASKLTLKNSSSSSLDVIFNFKTGSSVDGWITLDPNGSAGATSTGVAIWDEFYVNGNAAFNNINVNNTNILEFGYGLAGKEVNAGKIGYNLWANNTLSIVGAGTSAGGRTVKVWEHLIVDMTFLTYNATISNQLTTQNATVNGTINLNKVNVNSTNILEFGIGLSKETNAGKIGYNLLVDNTLSIVGAGTSSGGRTVKVWDHLIVNNDFVSYNASISNQLTTQNATVNNNLGVTNTITANTITATNITANNNLGVSNTITTNNLTANSATINNSLTVTNNISANNFNVIISSASINALTVQAISGFVTQLNPGTYRITTTVYATPNIGTALAIADLVEQYCVVYYNASYGRNVCSLNSSQRIAKIGTGNNYYFMIDPDPALIYGSYTLYIKNSTNNTTNVYYTFERVALAPSI